MLKVIDISKNFGTIKALDDISINPEPGQIYGLVGSNGCGKTTLMKHIMNIYIPDEGMITYDGEQIVRGMKGFENFYYVQDDLFFPNNYTLNMMFNYETIFYPNISKEKYQKLMKYFNMDGQKKLRSMSKGQKKQAAFVVAISTNPKVLLLDEIVDGLDAVVKRKFWNVIMDEVLDNDMTVIISSHDLKELDNICDKIGIMHEGKIIKEENMDNLKNNIKRVQFAVTEEFKGLKGKNFEIIKTTKLGSIYFCVITGDSDEFKRLLEESYGVLIFDNLPMNLEEIFITELGGIGYGIEEYEGK